MGKYRYINLISQFTNPGFFLKCTEIPDPFMSFHTKNLWHLQTLKNRNLLPWWPVITWSITCENYQSAWWDFANLATVGTLRAGSSKPLGKLISQKKKQTESCWDDDPTSTSEAICGNHFFTWGYLVETTEKVFPHLVQVYNFCGVVFRDSLITDWLVGQVLPLRIFLSFSWFISTSSWLGRYKEQFPNIRNIWNQNAFIIFPPQKKTRQHVWPKCLMQKKSTGQESFHLRPPPPSALRPNDNKISSTFPLKETPGISPISLRKLHPPPVLENPKIALPRVFCGRKIPPRWSNYQSLRWEPPPR